MKLTNLWNGLVIPELSVFCNFLFGSLLIPFVRKVLGNVLDGLFSDTTRRCIGVGFLWRRIV